MIVSRPLMTRFPAILLTTATLLIHMTEAGPSAMHVAKEKRKADHLLRTYSKMLHHHQGSGNIACHNTSATTCSCSGHLLRHNHSSVSQLKGIDERFLAATQSGCSPESIRSLLSFTPLADGAAKKKALTIVTTIKRLHDASHLRLESTASSGHDLEVLLALAENCLADAIEAVVVLVDSIEGGGSEVSQHSSDAYATAVLKDAIYTAATAHWKGAGDVGQARRELLGALTRKLSSHIFGEQPTYADMFDFADTSPLVGPGKLVAIANADVVLRHSERLDPELFHASDSAVVERSSGGAGGAGSRHFELEPRPLALVLSVVPHGCKEADHCIASKVGLSWDVHIYEVSSAKQA